MISDGTVFLEGDDFLVLSEDKAIISIKVKSPAEKLSEYFGNKDILLYGIDYIPKEQYDKALGILFEK